MQQTLKLERKYDLELRKGAQWCSITHNFCLYLIERKNYILKTFKYIPCADEIFLHSILWNSPFRKDIYNPENEYDSCSREIDWKRGDPYIWGKDSENDLNILLTSNKLFARKFSSQYMEFIETLLSKITENNENHD